MKRSCCLLTIAATMLLASCAKLVVVPVPAQASASTPAPAPTTDAVAASSTKKNAAAPSAKNAATSQIKAEGVFYALPKTFIRAQVNVDRTEPTAGTYLKYAEVFVPGEKLVCKTHDCADEKKKMYSLQPNATFTPLGEPDPANVYMVKFVGFGAVDQNIALTWTDTGLISTASASATNRTTDVVVSTLKLAAGIGAKAAFGATALAEDEKPVTKCAISSDNDPWILGAFQDSSVPQDAGSVLTGNYCAIPKDDRDADKYKKEKGETAFRNALNAYVKAVLPLADARSKVLAGATGLFEPTELLTKIETLLDQQVKKLFLGSKETKTWAGSIDIREMPCPGKAEQAVLRLNAEKGICLGDVAPKISIAPDAKPFPDGFADLLIGAECTSAPAVNLTTAFWPPEQLFQSVKDHTTDPSGDLSFRYRIPAQVKAELKLDTKSYGIGVFSVAQFGIVRALPANRHSKTLSYDLGMVEATGGLKSFKIGSTGAVDSGTVDAMAGISGTLLDARNATVKADLAAKQAAKDDVTNLTRQYTLLKLKDDICTIQKKYGLDCTIQP
jgi:Domain of unknown function (DUF4831)